MAIKTPQMVFGDLAEEGGTRSEARKAGCRVAGATARCFDGRSHARVKKIGALGVDQIHGALDDAVVDKEPVIRPSYDVDDGIADAKDVKLGHAELLLDRFAPI